MSESAPLKSRSVSETVTEQHPRTQSSSLGPFYFPGFVSGYWDKRRNISVRMNGVPTDSRSMCLRGTTQTDWACVFRCAVHTEAMRCSGSLEKTWQRGPYRNLIVTVVIYTVWSLLSMHYASSYTTNPWGKVSATFLFKNSQVQFPERKNTLFFLISSFSYLFFL
jgi:hypothetical protein